MAAYVGLGVHTVDKTLRSNLWLGLSLSITLLALGLGLDVESRGEGGLEGSRRCLSACRTRILRVELGDLHPLGETKFFHQPDAVVVHIELVPRESMACTNGVRMVIVMPSFATRQKGDPPAIA